MRFECHTTVVKTSSQKGVVGQHEWSGSLREIENPGQLNTCEMCVVVLIRFLGAHFGQSQLNRHSAVAALLVVT